MYNQLYDYSDGTLSLSVFFVRGTLRSMLTCHIRRLQRTCEQRQ